MQIKREHSPEFGVGIAIVEKGKILLTKRRDYPVWCIPGGHVYPGESVLDAAVREAREETGLDIQIAGFVGFYSLPHKWEKGSGEIIVLGKVSGGKLARVTDETLDARYFSIDQLPSDLVGWQFHEAIDALSGKSGVLAVLDTRLSLRQLREQASRSAGFDDVSSNEWLIRLCEHPKRYDLSDLNKS